MKTKIYLAAFLFLHLGTASYSEQSFSLNLGVAQGTGEFSSKGLLLIGRYTAEINKQWYWGTQLDILSMDYAWIGQIACFELFKRISENLTLKFVPGIGIY